MIVTFNGRAARVLSIDPLALSSIFKMERASHWGRESVDFDLGEAMV